MKGILGSGQAGNVYWCEDTVETGRVALKRLGTNNAGPWAEAQFLRQLQDDHIMPIRHAFADSGVRYLVTGVAEDGTINDRIVASGPIGLSPRDVIRWTRQTCLAAARAHDRGLIHNDIKPANQFLTSDGACQLGDFGSATLLKPGASTTTTSAFTYETVAPEVLLGTLTKSPLTTVRSDVYSIGASAYWALSGTPAQRRLPSEDDHDFMVRLMEGNTRIALVAPHVSAQLARCLAKAMSPNPLDRFCDASEFMTALGQVQMGTRAWERIAAHPGHEACWKGTPKKAGKPIIETCLRGGASPDARVIQSSYKGSGRRVPSGFAEATSANAFSVVRSVIRGLKK